MSDVSNGDDRQRLLTSAELAVVLGVSIWTLHRWVRRERQFPVVRLSPKKFLFDLSEVLAFFQSRGGRPKTYESRDGDTDAPATVDED